MPEQLVVHIVRRHVERKRQGRHVYRQIKHTDHDEEDNILHRPRHRRPLHLRKVVQRPVIERRPQSRLVSYRVLNREQPPERRKLLHPVRGRTSGGADDQPEQSRDKEDVDGHVERVLRELAGHFGEDAETDGDGEESGGDDRGEEEREVGVVKEDVVGV